MSKNDWQPSASIHALKQRAAIVQTIRSFFSARDVLEVTTPVLSQFTVTDPYLQSMQTTDGLYLQTSPEYPMKRLLAAGSGSIFQICPCFRQDESGRWHAPEFSMLEWYRVGFDHHQLMQEVDELLQYLLNTQPAKKISYRDCFYQHLGLDPFNCRLTELENCADDHDIHAPPLDDYNGWLDLLMTHLIEPHLGQEKPVILFDFPTTQAALAKIHDDVAQRFEVYVKGVELANGYHELTDPMEQHRRFTHNNERRTTLGLPTMAIDQSLIEAMEHGLPACAGVALGLDRLVMLALNKNAISEVMAF